MIKRNPDGGRIIIGLRPLPKAEASIATAVRLAAALEAEAVGMFVQEESLMNFAGLPFSGGLDAYGRPIESVTPSSMLREIDRMEKRWRRLLSDEAEKARDRSSFSRQRGEFFNIMKSALVSGDFLVMSSGVSEFESRQLLNYVAAIPTHIRGVVVVPRSIIEKQHAPVIALLDSDAGAQRVIPLAVRLAQLTGGTLEILVHMEAEGELTHRLSAIEEMLPRDISVNYRRVSPEATDSIATRLRHISPGFVITTLNDKLFGEVQSLPLHCRAARVPIVMLHNDGHDTSILPDTLSTGHG